MGRHAMQTARHAMQSSVREWKCSRRAHVAALLQMELLMDVYIQCRTDAVRPTRCAKAKQPPDRNSRSCMKPLHVKRLLVTKRLFRRMLSKLTVDNGKARLE